MSRYDLLSLYDIQLFGDAGAGEGTESGGGSPAGQETAALAQPQTGGKELSARRQQDREQAPDAGERQRSADDRTARFEEMIKGEYKDLYDQRVRDIVRRRLKGSEETSRRLSMLSPALETLARHYGVDAEDAEALGRAIQTDAALTAASAELRAAEERRQEQAKRQVSDWLRQARELRERYPSFDLEQEARDPRFRSLIGSGLSLCDAFEALHQREILPAAMAYSARRAEERLADSVIAGQRRPAEGAMGGQGPVLSKRDVNRLTRAERDEIEKRVARGEKIRF